jgi:hypothetical protein
LRLSQARRRRPGPARLQETPLFSTFLNSSYVRPEPVSVKRSFSVSKRHRTGVFRTRPGHMMRRPSGAVQPPNLMVQNEATTQQPLIEHHELFNL